MSAQQYFPMFMIIYIKNLIITTPKWTGRSQIDDY